jgi:hypothetical protein
MIVSLVLATTLVSTVAAGICPDGLLNANLQCCSTGVLGVEDLNCIVPSRQPSDGADFGKICGEAGRQAKCCGIPVAGQALVCVAAIGA